MAVSRILSPSSLQAKKLGDDHLSQARCRGTARSRRCGTVMRRYPRIKRTGCPPSVLSCTAWGFSCLANCSASGELLPRHFTLACASFKEPAVSFLRHFPSPLPFGNGARPAFAGRHAAVWCSDFPPANPAEAGLTSDHLPSRLT
jgi:hypothetical protein